MNMKLGGKQLWVKSKLFNLSLEQTYTRSVSKNIKDSTIEPNWFAFNQVCYFEKSFLPFQAKAIVFSFLKTNLCCDFWAKLLTIKPLHLRWIFYYFHEWKIIMLTCEITFTTDQLISICRIIAATERVTYVMLQRRNQIPLSKLEFIVFLFFSFLIWYTKYSKTWYQTFQLNWLKIKESMSPPQNPKTPKPQNPLSLIRW